MYSQMSELHNGTLEISSNFLVHRYVLKFRVPKHEPLWLFSLNNKKRIKEVQYNKNSLLLLKWHIKTLIINSFTAACVWATVWAVFSDSSESAQLHTVDLFYPHTVRPRPLGIHTSRASLCIGVIICTFFLWQDQYFMSSSEFVYNS